VALAVERAQGRGADSHADRPAQRRGSRCESRADRPGSAGAGSTFHAGGPGAVDAGHGPVRPQRSPAEPGSTANHGGPGAVARRFAVAPTVAAVVANLRTRGRSQGSTVRSGAQNGGASHSEPARAPQPHMNQQNQMRSEQHNAPQGGSASGPANRANSAAVANQRRVRKLRRALRARLALRTCRVKRRAGWW